MSGTPARRNEQLTFELGLRSQLNPKVFQTNPTLAAGDVKVSKDGASLANITNLPVAIDSGQMLSVTLTATEMNAVSRVAVLFHDAAGSEWEDLLALIPVSVRAVDDLAFPNTAGRGMDVDASGGVEVGSFQDDVIKGDAIDATAVTALQSGLATAAALATVDGNVDAILADTGTDGVVVNTFTAAAKAEVQAEAEDALEAYDLDHLIQVSAGSEEPTAGSYLDQVMHKDARQTFNRTTDSLEAIADRLLSEGVTVRSSVDGDDVEVLPYTTWSFPLTGCGDISARSKLYFTVKGSPETEADASSLLQIEETAGLLYFNGAAASNAALGTLTVDDENDGDVTVWVDDSLTGLALRQGWTWGLKMIDTSGDSTEMAQGSFAIVRVVTRTV